MAIIDEGINRMIAERVIANDREHQKLHNPSGKLSASMLGQPLQWQILSVFGMRGEHDEYTLRKFQRGKDVEDRIVGFLKTVSTQERVEYRGVSGVLDFVADTSQGWDFNRGTIPVEVKSVTNMKYKRILMAGAPDRGHALQGALYALAKGSEWFAVTYVASDDYRVRTYLMPTMEWQPEVDKIIDDFNAQVLTGRVPVFVPKEAWQANKKYNNFPEWSELSEEEIEAKLQGMITANKK